MSKQHRSKFAEKHEILYTDYLKWFVLVGYNKIYWADDISETVNWVISLNDYGT